FAPNLAINAQNLAALARIAPMGFPKGSEAIKGSESLPDIWTKPEAYKAAMEKWQAESVKLAEVALKGDAEAVKAQIPNVSKACKGCHQDFRKE
ncbi:MAG: cytochrome c, partial [Rhodospirillales bacterium]|nr:cytochrome c [Rhodospirillales bacterium]